MRIALACAILAIADLSLAQDLIAVDWNGSIYSLDSSTGASTPIGFGLGGLNNLARDGNGVLWATSNNRLCRIDPAAVSVTVLTPTPDVRALAAGPGSLLYAVAFTSVGNRFWYIDSATGATWLIGNTGTNRIQGMTTYNGALYAWDLDQGLGVIDPVTGVFTDVNPLVNFGSMQWLATLPNGQLIGGGWELFTIDVTTGVASPYAATTYVRGAEVAQFATRYGSGCSGGAGNLQLSVTGLLRPGTQVLTVSTGHSMPEPGTVTWGVLALGFSNTMAQGVPLPVSLDPVLGTNGCSVYTSSDVTRISAVSGPPYSMVALFGIPTTMTHFTVYVQHFALDPVPGGLSASNGVAVRIAD